MTPLYKRLLAYGPVSGFLVVFSLFCVVNLYAQPEPQYRTFSQQSLSEKKAKAGKYLGSSVCFRFYNTTGSTVNDLHARFNTHIVAVTDAGGFPTADIVDRGKSVDLSGMDVPDGDSVTICLTVQKKDAGSQVNFWWWTNNGQQVGSKNGSMTNIGYTPIQTEPNGGNVLEYIYKRIIDRPNGLIVGVPQDNPDSAKVHGWIRYMKADRKYFIHIGEPRCFDAIALGNSGRTKPFVKQLRNPHVKKHDNHLLGELHALKLACVANDSGFTEPLDTNAALFCDLVYNDSVNSGDPCNHLSVREIIALADSALTYCGSFDSAMYAELDNCISRINAAFDGPYVAASFSPLIIAGTHSLSDVYFMHAPPPGNTPVVRPKRLPEPEGTTPEVFALFQNYPNPFNPTTTIEFNLPVAARVTLTVYNLLGEQVASVVQNEEFPDGEESIDFDASALSSGIYFYRIVALSTEGQQPVYSAVKKMILMK